MDLYYNWLQQLVEIKIVYLNSSKKKRKITDMCIIIPCMNILDMEKVNMLD